MRALIISLGIIIALALGANFIANDRPLLMVHHGHVFFPAFQKLSTSDFGLTEEGPVSFYDSQQGIGLINQSFFVWHPLICFGPNTIDLTLPAPHPPTRVHWLGTDDHGRDIVVRVLYGLRLSMMFGLSLAALGILIGMSIGGASRLYGGGRLI